MPSVASSGTISNVSINVENVFFSATTNNWFSGYLDLTNMASGDTTILKVYTQIVSPGNYVVYVSQTYTGAQSSPQVYFAPMPSDIAIKFTLTQTAGTARTYQYRFYAS